MDERPLTPEEEAELRRLVSFSSMPHDAGCPVKRDPENGACLCGQNTAAIQLGRHATGTLIARLLATLDVTSLSDTPVAAREGLDVDRLAYAIENSNELARAIAAVYASPDAELATPSREAGVGATRAVDRGTTASPAATGVSTPPGTPVAADPERPDYALDGEERPS